MPKALVNIVDIPLPKDIENALKDVKKIKLLKLRFFPLNSDINFNPWGNDINKEIKNLDLQIKVKPQESEFTNNA